ncbi:uncharacterized protein [Aegilops tauschii subsp. strangulata]|uniref:uncharacterized protein n=1 Tax=Aegilops tauschii subsp. strangulata TaxID=200361 RepID=UPI003CC85F31
MAVSTSLALSQRLSLGSVFKKSSRYAAENEVIVIAIIFSTLLQALGKAHVPHLQWKVHDFSALLETGAKSAKSAHFHCSGYKWFLKVTPPMHNKPGAETPYVGLSLKLGRTTLKPGDTVNAVFELSVYNHAKKIYCGRKASHNFDLNNTCSKDECLIPLQKLLKSSAFLVDDSCVFGVKILKIKVCSPEKKAVMVLKKATTLQNLFIQKKGLIKGTYTWTMDNYHELDLKRYVCSPTFEVGGHKWYSYLPSVTYKWFLLIMCMQH